MKYCVVKDTVIIIDGSENPEEIMLQNAINAGYAEEEIEILTEEEYQARKDAEPVEPPAETPEEKTARLEEENAQLQADLAQAKSDIITTMLGVVEVYNLLLTLQQPQQ